MSDLSTLPNDYFNGYDNDKIHRYAQSLNIADENFEKLCQNMRDGKVVINSSDDAMAAYSKTVQQTNRTTTLATAGTKALSVAMKVLSSIGWMIVITAITEGVTWLVTYNKRLEESRQEMIDAGKEAAQLTKNLDGLVEQYRKLGEDGGLDNSEREQAYNIQQQINELLGDEVEYINLANGEYKEQLELLKKLQYEKANDKYADFKDAKEAAEESLKNKAIKYGQGNIGVGVWETSGEIDALRNLLKNNEMEEFFGLLTSSDGSQEYNAHFKIDFTDMDSILESFDKMKELKTILAKSYADEINSGGKLEDFYNNLTKAINDMSDAVQKYKDAMSDYNINEAVIQFNEKEFKGIKGALIDSESAMTTWITSMMKSKSVTDGVQSELIALAKTWYPQYISQINEAVNAEATKTIQDALVDKSLSGNIESLKVEATTLGLTESAMISLVLAEINFNKNNLNVSQKVSALKELATWAGVAQAKMNSIFTANSKSTMKDKTAWANANNVTINKYADKDGTHTYTYNGKTYSGVNAVNEALLNEAIQSQIDKMNNIKVSPATVTSSGGGGGSSSSSSTKELKEIFDWVEIKLQRLQRTITNFGKTVSATWKSWTDRNSALKSQISAVTQEINLQANAANKYLSLANSVGLGEGYKSLVRNGTLDISTITDENTIDAIKQYQEWHEAYLSALDAKQDAEDELASLVREDFDMIAKQFDSEISLVEKNISLIESYINQTEMKGNLASKNYYSAMYEEESKNLSLLQSKYDELSLKINNGVIKQGSEEWNSMLSEIKDVKQEIIESTTALEEYSKTMRELDWEIFDLIQDKIGNVINESNDWIDLLSNSKLFNDDGSITSQGQTTIGLHAINLKVYENQVNDYAKAIKDLDTQFADDSLDKNYLERREELAELQRESILNCESEKSAIKDLMSESYDTMLSYMQQIIDKRKEMLSEITDTRSFQRSIEEQTAEVAKYQKIIQSLSNMSDTEEGKSVLQKYQVSLEEAEKNLEDTMYDKYISDQEKMLDSLIEDTETFITKRLDDTDKLISDVSESVDKNADTIKTTLEQEVEKAGGILSNEIHNIWNGTDGFKSVVSGVSNTLLDIKNLVEKMVDDGNFDTSVDIRGWRQNSNGTWSHINKSGEKSTGWQKLDWNGKQDWYSFDESGNMHANKWIGDYFVGSSGQMLTDTWVGHNGVYYYVGSDGKWLNLPNWTSHGRPNDGYPIYEYAKGSRRIPFDQLALLGEEGQELKLNAKEGTLSLVGEGDMVWTNEQTKRLWELSKTTNPVMPNTQIPNYDFSKIGTNISKQNSSGDVIFEKIEMYGVNDPQDFARQLKEVYDRDIGNVRKMINTDVHSKYGSQNYRRYL